MATPRTRVAWKPGFTSSKSTRRISVAAGISMSAAALYMVHFGTRYQLDLRVYRAASVVLVHGDDPYTKVFTAHRLSFTYPPSAMLVLAPLAFFRIGVDEVLWWLANVMSLVASMYLIFGHDLGSRPLLRERRFLWSPDPRRLVIAVLVAGLALLALEPVRSSIDFGQINLILMFFVVADLMRPTKRFAGVLTGLAAAVKLTPLVFILYFLVRGDRRSVVRAVVTFVFAGLASWLVLPREFEEYWSHLVFDVKRVGPIGDLRNQSIDGLVHRIPLHSATGSVLIWLGLSVFVLGGVAVVVRRLASEGRSAESVMALGMAEVLVSPVSWTHHWSWLALGPPVIFKMWHRYHMVAVALSFTVVVAIVAPYAWLRAGVFAFVAENSMVLFGLVTMIVWVISSGTIAEFRAMGPRVLARAGRR